jgi:adenylosuccinate synthase
VPLTVVVGGQYGSEGKGKLVSHLACSTPGRIAVVRGGGSNAGHTAEGCGKRLLLRQLPSGAVNPQCLLAMSAGMQIDVNVLFTEIEAAAVTPGQLIIDPRANVIEDTDEAVERSHALGERVGSTLSGTGSALARKVMRTRDVRCVRDVSVLGPFIDDVSLRMNALVASGASVIVEGTQGAGLSLHHGPYPYVTARDTTAAAFLSEAGISPVLVDDVVVVLRTYPIRVAGASGPMHNEIGWEEVRRRSGYQSTLAEYTSVTGRLRRVSEFDWDLAELAVRLNAPTSLAIHGLDYLDHSDLGCRRVDDLSAVSRAFVDELESRLGVPARWLFTGPGGADLIDLGPRWEPRPGPIAARRNLRSYAASG